MMLKKKIIEIGEEMTKFWHLEKMCRYKNSEKLIVAHVIRVRSAAQKPKKLNRRAAIIKQLRVLRLDRIELDYVWTARIESVWS